MSASSATGGTTPRRAAQSEDVFVATADCVCVCVDGTVRYGGRWTVDGDTRWPDTRRAQREKEEVSVWTAYGGGWRREDRGGRRRTGTATGTRTGMDDCSRTQGPKDQVRSQKFKGAGSVVFFSFSPASRSHEDGEKRGSIATPKATGSETCQCQDGPSRAYRRGSSTGTWGCLA